MRIHCYTSSPRYISNVIHQRSISIFENSSYLPAMALYRIKLEEVIHEWKTVFV
jgi:hypothetical protein